jgi:hypothetical protein
MENKLPWHGIGILIDANSLPSAEDFLRENGLNWQIKKFVPVSEPVWGVHLCDYDLVTNAEVFTFVDEIIANH